MGNGEKLSVIDGEGERKGNKLERCNRERKTEVRYRWGGKLRGWGLGIDGDWSRVEWGYGLVGGYCVGAEKAQSIEREGGEGFGLGRDEVI